MKDTAGEERRRFHRFHFRTRALMRFGDVECVGALLDISYSGALFESATLAVLAPVAAGDRCLLTVPLGISGRRELRLPGQVGYAQGGLIGVQFRLVDSQVLGGLMQIIERDLGTQESSPQRFGRLLDDSDLPGR